MYENRIKNDRRNFEIPTLFILQTRKSRAGKCKITYLFVLYFSASSSVILYPISIHSLASAFHFY